MTSNILIQRRDKLRANCINSIKCAIKNVEKYAENDTDNFFSVIRTVGKDISKIDEEFIRKNNALERTKAYEFEDKEFSKSVSDIYENFLQEELSKNSEQAGNEILNIINSAVSQGSSNSRSSLDDELILTTSHVTPKDPISKQKIKDPAKNIVCHHIYEYDVIVSYIKKMKTKARCPYVGCINNDMKLTHIRRDATLRTRFIGGGEGNITEDLTQNDSLET